tara:strand:- start:4929 stop:6314 length:1386 start_codon:yes stop_codon:yes gene_type:complete
MKNITLILSLLFITNIIFSQETVQVGDTELEVREVIGNLDVPWEIKWGPDSNGEQNFIWITERAGIVSRINVESGEKIEILNLTSIVTTESESGMLGMEFHPDFENNSIVFIVYTYYQGWNIKERLSAFSYNSNLEILENEQILIDGITGYSTHNGSRIHALEDNTLLMSTGDAQNQSDSQNVNILTGKTLRIDISENNFGGVPSDNPIPGSYVWSWGHRNAQGIEVAPNGIIYSSEHGPQNDDELNILEPNRNYGWPNVMGFCDGFSEQAFCDENNVVEPLVNWTPTIAPSDIIWYDHPSIPEFQNTLLMTVLKDKMLVRFEFSEDGTQVINQTEFFNYEWGRLRDICVSPDGKIYLATNGSSWPSQPPNEIIELSNANFNTSSINNFSLSNNINVIKTEGKINIESPKCNVSIFDSTGKLIFQEKNHKNSSISIKHLSTGLYNILFTNSIESKVVKLIL